MAIIPGTHRRMLDVMTTGLSMAKFFYSPSIMSLQVQPIPTSEVFRTEPERPCGYSHAHWRKIQKERKQRLAQNPVTIRMSREMIIDRIHDDLGDCMAYLSHVDQFAGGYWNEAGSATAAPEECLPEALTFADIDRVINMCGAPARPPRYDLYWHQLGNGQVYELPELDAYSMAALGTDGRRILVVPKDALDEWYRMLIDAGIDVRLQPRFRQAASQDSGQSDPGGVA